jgi:deoxyribodipyrimidine photo-lyase
MNTTLNKVAIHWLRRDLRLHDNTALYHALQSGYPVLLLYIWDSDILTTIQDQDNPRVTFIHTQLQQLQTRLREHGSSLLIRHGAAEQVWKELVQEYAPAAVYWNHDYEPAAQQRDQQVRQLLSEHSVPVHTSKDQVIFEKDEVLKNDGTPYTIFTPYSRVWRQRYDQHPPQRFASQDHLDRLQRSDPGQDISLQALGFTRSLIEFPDKTLPEDIIRHYHKTRDYPAQQGTSRLSVHLRFGTVSIRELVEAAHYLNDTWLNELIWREFYMMILWHYPHVVTQSFKRQYDQIEWENDEAGFERWCEGMTGFPIVDAGMRELLNTGYMHNRVRMITASFLTKDLLIDWRWGERHFGRQLCDYELSSNNGGWQWAAGTGCDAAPYFRIFNPLTQAEKYDPDGAYCRRWIPELGTDDYPQPMVDHKAARKRALARYKAALR